MSIWNSLNQLIYMTRSYMKAKLMHISVVMTDICINFVFVLLLEIFQKQFFNLLFYCPEVFCIVLC